MHAFVTKCICFPFIPCWSIYPVRPRCAPPLSLPIIFALFSGQHCFSHTLHAFCHRSHFMSICASLYDILSDTQIVKIIYWMRFFAVFALLLPASSVALGWIFILVLCDFPLCFSSFYVSNINYIHFGWYFFIVFPCFTVFSLLFATVCEVGCFFYICTLFGSLFLPFNRKSEEP